MKYNPLEEFLSYFKNEKPYEFDFKKICFLTNKEIRYYLSELSPKQSGDVKELIPSLYFLIGGEYDGSVWELLDRNRRTIYNFGDIRFGAGQRGTYNERQADLFCRSKSNKNKVILGTSKNDKKGGQQLGIDALKVIKNEQLKGFDVKLVAITEKDSVNKTEFNDFWTIENGKLITMFGVFLYRVAEAGYDLKKIESSKKSEHCSRDAVQAYLLDQILQNWKKGTNNLYLDFIMRTGKSHIALLAALKMGFKKILILNPCPSSVNNQWGDIPKEYKEYSNYDVYVSSDVGNSTIKFDDKDNLIVVISNQKVKRAKTIENELCVNNFPDLLSTDWDLVIYDEVHRDRYTIKSSKAFSNIKSKYSLELSGTMEELRLRGIVDDAQCIRWGYFDNQKCKNRNHPD